MTHTHTDWPRTPGIAALVVLAGAARGGEMNNPCRPEAERPGACWEWDGTNCVWGYCPGRCRGEVLREGGGVRTGAGRRDVLRGMRVVADAGGRNFELRCWPRGEYGQGTPPGSWRVETAPDGETLMMIIGFKKCE